MPTQEPLPHAEALLSEYPGRLALPASAQRLRKNSFAASSILGDPENRFLAGLPAVYSTTVPLGNTIPAASFPK